MSNTSNELSSAKECVERADDYARNGELNIAIDKYTEVILLNQNNAEVYKKRGVAYARKGGMEADEAKAYALYDTAINDFSEAIRINPDYFGAYYNLGLVRFNKGENEKAVKAFTEAIRIDPNDPDSYVWRGNANDVNVRTDDVIKDYEKAISLGVADADIYFNLGCAYSITGTDGLGEAKKAYDEAIRINPKYVMAYCNRGNAYYGMGKKEEAFKDYEIAIGLDPNFALTYCNRGNAYYDEEKYGKAIEDYSKAIDCDNGYVKAYLRRAMAYHDNGEIKKAIGDYRTVLNLCPGYIGVKETLAGLGVGV